MLDIGKETPLPTPKCYFTCTTLPAYLDTTQQPTKNPPFSLLHSTPYYHTLTLLTPASPPLGPQDVELKYAKINLSLLEILTGDFFTNKIKKGNVLLVSAPLYLSSTSSSATITLVEGVLTITCDRATYERAGLSGKPIPNPHARKHGTPKFKIELNLRLPSMLAGKKGFERLLHAAKSVFVGEITWLFYDISSDLSTTDTFLGENVEIKHITAQTEELKGAIIPPFPADGADISKSNQDDLTDLLEWLSLAAISSPRIYQGDLVDEIISRYSVPNTTSATSTIQTLTKMTYTGFLPNTIIANIFAKVVIAANKSWFAILVQGFDGDKGVVVLKTQDQRALCWDLEG